MGVKMTRLKTATKRLRKTGLPLSIWRNQHGYVVVDGRYRFSESRIFDTADSAVVAVLDGYRPTPTRESANPRLERKEVIQMRVKIFTAQNSDFEKAAAEVEHQINAWLAHNLSIEITSAKPTHVANFDDMGVDHCYSLAVVYK